MNIEWDRDLLSGYSWRLLRNFSWISSGFWSLVNPGVVGAVAAASFDVVAVLGHGAPTFLMALMGAGAARRPVLTSTDAIGLADARGATKLKARAKSRLLSTLYRHVAGVLAPSTSTELFLRSLGVPPSRIFSWPYTVDNDWFAGWSSYEAARLRDDWGARRRLVALYCGKLVPWKQPDALLEAAALLPGIHVVFAGDGEMRSGLEAQAGALGMADRTTFLGFVNQGTLPNVYRASDVLVLPSAYEPFGLVVNEAFASGRPAIVSEACGCAADLIRPGVTGWTFPVGDVGELRLRLAALLEPGVAERMGYAAHELISKWDLELNARRFLEAVTAVVREPA